jgi:hypothetical protein
VSTFIIDEDTPILVEFTPRPGVEQVSIFDLSPEEIAEKSKKALDSAMGTIQKMAQRVSALRDAIPAEFSQVEVEFGIKLDWEVGPILAKAGTEASLSVTLTWEREEKEKNEQEDE